MIFFYVWLFVFFLFIIIPACFNKARRDQWVRRFKERRWNVPLETRPPQGTANADEGFRFVMSRAAEDDIRKSFILESLSKYSKDITTSDITTAARLRSLTETSVVTTGSADIESALPANDTKNMDNVPEEGKKDVENSDSNDDCSTDDVVVGDDADPMDEFMGDSETTITIPVAGECHQAADGNDREVPNGCAICLSSFDVEDRITWSSNKSCNHVFHHECILDWFCASGRRALKRQRRQEARTGHINFPDDPVKRITSCPMVCPCCRQEFVSPPQGDDTNSNAYLVKIGSSQSHDDSTATEGTSEGTSSGNSSESSPAVVAPTGPDAV